MRQIFQRCLLTGIVFLAVAPGVSAGESDQKIFNPDMNSGEKIPLFALVDQEV